MLVASGGASGFVLPFKLKCCAYLDQLMTGSCSHAQSSICALHIVPQQLLLLRLGPSVPLDKVI